VKLNTKRLYEADGYAVKELMKIASQLQKAMREAEDEQKLAKNIPKTNNSNQVDQINFEINLKVSFSLLAFILCQLCSFAQPL